MLIARIAGATHNLGAPKGWDAEKDGTCGSLPVRIEVAGDETPRMLSAWTPTPEEIAAIVAGAPIYLSVVGYSHPPVMLSVGARPDPSPQEVAEQAREAEGLSVLQADLREMLTILGMGDHARPQSPHEVFQEVLGVLRARLASVRCEDPRAESEVR